VQILLLAGCATSSFAADLCYETAERLKKELGIDGDYDPRLRVERKTTNTKQDADTFVQFINRVLRPSKGESLVLRDVSSDSSQVLVTSTNYPFSKSVLSRLNLKIRVREYGQRGKGSNEPFNSTTGEYVNLEIKAKLPMEGVVVKPILKIPKSLMPALFSSKTVFEQSKNVIAETLIANNSRIQNIEGVVGEVVRTLEHVHQMQALLTPTGRIPCENVEYQRNAYVMEVADGSGQKRKVQLTFDRAVSLREGVDPGLAPSVVGRNSPNAKYPPDSVVIEMKTDLVLNQQYLDNPTNVRAEFPSYFLVRRVYEKLQSLTVDGFEADSGKAAHFRRNTTTLRQFAHFVQ
jgi:hypothetical protein